QWTNEYAAFPSMHAAWAIWVAIQLTRMYPRRWPAALGWLYFVGTSFVVIGTGNHYVIDVLAGAAIMLAAHFACTRLPVPRFLSPSADGGGAIGLRADAAVSADVPGAVRRDRLDRCRKPGPVDLRRPRRRELDRFLDQLPSSLDDDRKRSDPPS